ncbi:ABC transporter substrate-binding protein [Actinoplanes sp. CA-054009]
MINRRGFLSLGAAASAGVLLSACGGNDAKSGGPAPKSSADLAAALSKPTTLTFWTWLTGIEQEVKLFEAKYPNIKVNVVNAGQGNDQYTKLRSALKAGNGAPDVVQIGLDTVGSFAITGDLLDIGPYGASDVKDDFVEWTWKQVSDGDKVYAIPQDTGPMGMLYRKDIFDQYGLTVPTTWEEFAEQGKKLHAANPKIAMMNLPNNDAPNIFGYAWQVGARPFQVDGSNVTIAVNSPEMKKLADYWTPLVQQGVFSADPDFNNDWYAGLSNGSYATWVTAAWAPQFLQGSAAKTAGKWRVAPMPQWGTGAAVSGNWGGSTSAVPKQTKNPEAAAALAIFLNHDPQSSLLLTQKQSLFPPLKATLADPKFTGGKNDFFGGQKVNEEFATYASTVSNDFQFPPFNDYVISSFDPSVGVALTKKAPLSAALDGWQDTLVTYAGKQGFKVNG